MENLTPKYKRVLLKLSGEALAKDVSGILNFEYIEQIASVLKKCVADGVQIAIVVGAGNIWRGRQSGTMDRARADQMGMLATAINSLALEETFNSVGLKSRAMMVMEVNSFADPYRIRDARRHLDEGEVVIIGGGTSNPYFSTDTASALRGIEIEADGFFKGTRVDGIYTADPEKDPTAVKFDTITFDEVYTRNLKIMDMTAFTLCKENGLNIIVFDMDTPGNLQKVLEGENIGTLVHK